MKELYNHLAEGYDLRQDNPFTLLLRKKEKSIIKKFTGGLAIDLGCGTGYHLDFYKNSLGLDISNKMLEWARTKNKPLVQASIENLPIKTNSIDTVWCFYSVLNMADFEKSVSEIGRAVKNKGKVLLSVISVNDIDKKDADRKQKIKKFRLHGKRISMRLFEKEELVDEFKKHGFILGYFDSIFRLQKPVWGNFQELSFFEKIKLKLERLASRNEGRVYFFVFSKTASATT